MSEKRYFYTDRLATAWVYKYFGIITYLPHDSDKKAFFEMTGEEILEDTNFKTYILPDSLHLLEPQLWDIIQYPSPSSKDKEFRYCHQLTNAALVEAALYTWNKSTRIIQRNGIPFIWPESEEIE